MLRRTVAVLKTSPFMVFVKDLSKSGKLKGMRAPGKYAAKQYRSLSPAAKAALVKRADATVFSNSDKYKRLAKREMARKDVPVSERYAALRQKWAAMKKAQQKPKAASKPKSAKSKVKKAGKKAKNSNKKARK